MKRWTAWSLVLLAGCAEDHAPTTQPFEAPLAAPVGVDGFVASFSDEFEGGALDSSKWFAWSGDLHHASTKNTAAPSLAVVRGGSVFLEAVSTPENKAFPYATGYVDTHGLFAQTYGKIEFRARAVYAPGVWFALWGRSWSNLVPELDIELLAEDITQAWFVNHWAVPPLPPDERRGFTTVDGLDIRQMHVYAIIWRPDVVEWQIDGQAYRRVTDAAKIPHEPMFWIMNAWVGGWGGTPSAATHFPAALEVDYLRISRLEEWMTEPSIRIADPKYKLAASATLDAEIADFAPSAHVEVREGATLVETLRTPPFRFAASHLKRGAHTLTFVGSDGARTASTSLDVAVE